MVAGNLGLAGRHPKPPEDDPPLDSGDHRVVLRCLWQRRSVAAKVCGREGLWQGLGLWQRSLWQGRSVAGIGSVAEKSVAWKVGSREDCGREGQWQGGSVAGIRSVAEKSVAWKVCGRD